MPTSILHIGLPLDHPLIPAADRPELTQRLANLRQRMQNAGYTYEFFHASPDTGLEAFKDRLRTQHFNGVMLGGGLLGTPEMSFFMEQIVDAAHEAAPHAKIMFHNHSIDVRDKIERWFPPSN